MVRDTLGEDAIIVATREENGGKAVRVTAAVESDPYTPPLTAREDDDSAPAFELGTEPAIATDEEGHDWLQYDVEDEGSAVAERLTDAMLKHAAPEDVIDQVVSCATVMGIEDPHVSLVAAIEHMFGFRPLPQKASARAFMMVGPPGAGKTLAVAKMAARGVLNGLNMAVITTDTVRAGGVEQLQAFTKLLKIDLKTAQSPKEIAALVEDLHDADQILIDTPGMNPYDNESIRQIARFAKAGEIEPVLVLPAGSDADEAADIGQIFAAFGVKRIIPTRLDAARRMGGILAAAYTGGLNFADASNTAQVAEGLTPLSPQRLSEFLMPRHKSPPASTQRKTG